MDCCSLPAQFLQYAPEIGQTAEQLASLLATTPEYQEFTRLASLIDLDPDVKRISMEIRRSQLVYGATLGKSRETLQAELEALPAVQTYHKAEAALKDLFRSVDQVISAGAGVVFAPNAQQSGCG